jgi:hypothetical protein
MEYYEAGMANQKILARTVRIAVKADAKEFERYIRKLG